MENWYRRFFFQWYVKSTKSKCEMFTSFLEIPVCSGVTYRRSLRSTWQSRPGFEIQPITSSQRRKAVSDIAINWAEFDKVETCRTCLEYLKSSSLRVMFPNTDLPRLNYRSSWFQPFRNPANCSITLSEEFLFYFSIKISDYRFISQRH